MDFPVKHRLIARLNFLESFGSTEQPRFQILKFFQNSPMAASPESVRGTSTGLDGWKFSC
jgi:hypothetical protein